MKPIEEWIHDVLCDKWHPLHTQFVALHNRRGRVLLAEYRLIDLEFATDRCADRGDEDVTERTFFDTWRRERAEDEARAEAGDALEWWGA